MKVELPIDGYLEILSENRIRLLGGIPGVTPLEDFSLIPSVKAEPFFWLVCNEDPRIYLVVIDPQVIFPDYAPQVAEEELEKCSIKSRDELLLYSIVNFADPENPTINLRSPLIVGKNSRIGKQVILAEERYLIRTPLLVYEDEGS